MFPEIARDEVFRLETRRLWLRWPRAADARCFPRFGRDWQVARLTAALPHPYALADADQFIGDSREDNLRGSALRLALTLKSGDARCRRGDWRGGARRAARCSAIGSAGPSGVRV